jgi:hypothetical protein
VEGGGDFSHSTLKPEIQFKNTVYPQKAYFSSFTMSSGLLLYRVKIDVYSENLAKE